MNRRELINLLGMVPFATYINSEKEKEFISDNIEWIDTEVDEDAWNHVRINNVKIPYICSIDNLKLDYLTYFDLEINLRDYDQLNEFCSFMYTTELSYKQYTEVEIIHPLPNIYGIKNVRYKINKVYVDGTYNRIYVIFKCWSLDNFMDKWKEDWGDYRSAPTGLKKGNV